MLYSHLQKNPHLYNSIGVVLELMLLLLLVGHLGWWKGDVELACWLGGHDFSATMTMAILRAT